MFLCYFHFVVLLVLFFIIIVLLIWIGIVSSPQPRTKLNINKYNSNLTIFAWIDFTWVLVIFVHRTVRMRRAPVLASSLALIWVLIGQAFGYMWTSLHLSMLCVYTEHNSKLSIFLQELLITPQCGLSTGWASHWFRCGHALGSVRPGIWGPLAQLRVPVGGLHSQICLWRPDGEGLQEEETRLRWIQTVLNLQNKISTPCTHKLHRLDPHTHTLLALSHPVLTTADYLPQWSWQYIQLWL